MTRLQAVGVMLVALGLIYALLYAAWVRKRRQHASASSRRNSMAPTRRWRGSKPIVTPSPSGRVQARAMNSARSRVIAGLRDTMKLMTESIEP